MSNLTLSITASGTKAEVLKALEAQRTADHPHSSLQNGILDHVEGFVEEQAASASVQIALSGTLVVA